MTHKQKIAKMLLVKTGGAKNLWVLAGPARAAARAELMSELKGVKRPQSKSGVNALRDELYALYEISGDCEATREENFWIKITACANGSDRSEREILIDIAECYNQMSPENLARDGESTKQHVRREAARIRGKLRELFSELGREATEEQCMLAIKPATPAPKRALYKVSMREIRADRNEGICLACGHRQDECEPDTSKRKCESCEQCEVYGLEQAVFMDAIEVV